MQVNNGKPRWLRRIVLLIGWTLGSLFVLYVVALCDEHFEAHRAVRVYNQVLTVRLGDTVADFNRKAPGCKIAEHDGEYNCLVESVVRHIEHPFDWYMMNAHEDAYLWQSINRQKVGLRDWHLLLYVTVQQGRVSEMYAQFYVVGRDMALGCFWSLEPEKDRASLDDSAKRATELSVTHITSSWSGWGYRMRFTPRSSEHELRMREINANCLTSFIGCRDSIEMVPNLPQREDRRYW